MSKTPQDFSDFLIEHLKQSTDQSTIDLIPAPCGTGKSFSMTVQIYEALRDDNKLGILLVTDEVERMEGFVINDYDSDLQEYIDRNRDNILIYTAENAKTDYDKLYKKQVIVMSTQRFFNLSREEVLNLTGSYIPKRHIFVDERAPLTEVVKIDAKTFNDIDSLIWQHLDNTKRYKRWIIKQWESIRRRYNNYIKQYERENEGHELKKYHVDTKYNEADVERLKHLLLDTYNPNLRKEDWEYRKKVKAVLQIVTDGALFISKKRVTSKYKDMAYSSFFMVILDHSDLLLDVGSKSVILDGTGTIDPVYDALYINHVDCSNFDRDLSKLTINLVNVNTSKRTLTQNGGKKQVESIIKYLKTIPKVDIVFTYGNNKDEGTNSKNHGGKTNCRCWFYNRSFREHKRHK